MRAILELEEQHPANAALATKLMWFNESHARPYDFVPVRLAILDARDNLMAGLLGATGWAWLNIDILFVEAGQRNSGLVSCPEFSSGAQSRSQGSGGERCSS